MSREDSMELLDSEPAARPKTHQILVHDDDSGLSKKGSSFAVAPSGWLGGAEPVKFPDAVVHA